MATRKMSSRHSASNNHHQRFRHKGSAPSFTGVEDPAMIAMFTLLMAKQVTVVANSITYNGLFAGLDRLSNKQDLCIELRYAQVSRLPSPPVVVNDLRASMAKRILIPVTSITKLTAPMPDGDNTRQDGPKGFVTDDEIARGPVRVGRELKRFEDFADSNVLPSTSKSINIDEQTFGEIASNGNRNWDQFQVNRDKFGVSTTFDENEYTTRIDRSNANYENLEREAQRMAQEIERSDSDNIHIREERNQQIGTDYDEEARFSGVQRKPLTFPPRTSSQPRRSYLAAASASTEQARTAKPSAANVKGSATGKHSSNANAKPSPGNRTHPASNKATAANGKQQGAANGKQQGAANGKQQGAPNGKQQGAANSKQQGAANSKQQGVASGKQGVAGGKQQGVAGGKQQGVAGGKQQGVAGGKQQGVAGGKQQGVASGKQQGAASGKQQGVASGKQQGGANVKQQQSSKALQAAKSSSGSGKAQTAEAKNNTSAAKPAANVSAPGTAKSKSPASKTSSQHSESLSVGKASATDSSSTAPHGRNSASRPRPSSTKGNLSSTHALEAERVSFEKQVKSSAHRERSGSIPQLIKIRNSVTGRNSPNQSRNSPMPASAATDTSTIGVLNLDAQTPNFGPERIKQFEEYKTQIGYKSLTANRDKITDELKKFSTSLDSRNGSLRRAHSSPSENVVRVSGNVPVTSAAAPNSSTGKSPVANVTTSTTGASVKNSNKSTSSERKTTPSKRPVTGRKDTSEDSSNKKSIEPSKATDPSASKMKLKSKLNPNAQEFKLNPDAPVFKPVPSKRASNPPPSQPSGMYNPYPAVTTPMEFSRAMPQHPGYAMAMQPLTHVPYGGQPYVVMPAGVHAAVPGSGAMAYQYVQGNHISFPPGPVPGRYQPSPGVPGSYGGVYPQVAPIMMAQTPQRVPSSPYYYNAGRYSGAQVGNPNMSPHPAQHIFQAHHMSPGHIQGGMGGGHRGPHNNHRRGGPGKGRGKQYGHSHGHPNTNTADRQAPASPQGAGSSETGPL